MVCVVHWQLYRCIRSQQRVSASRNETSARRYYSLQSQRPRRDLGGWNDDRDTVGGRDGGLPGEALKNCERLCDQLQKAAERPLHPSANRAKTLAHDAGKIQNTLRALVDASRQRRLGG